MYVRQEIFFRGRRKKRTQRGIASVIEYRVCGCIQFEFRLLFTLGNYLTSYGSKSGRQLGVCIFRISLNYINRSPNYHQADKDFCLSKTKCETNA